MARQSDDRSQGLQPTGVAPPPPATCKLLEKMRNNPQDDWNIKNVETVSRQIGLTCSPPTGGGSHYKVYSPHIEGMLTIPAKKPIKPVYIKHLVALSDAHIATLATGARK